MGCGCRSGTIAAQPQAQAVAAKPPNLTRTIVPVAGSPTSAICQKCKTATLQAVRPVGGGAPYMRCPKCGSLFYRAAVR